MSSLIHAMDRDRGIFWLGTWNYRLSDIAGFTTSLMREKKVRHECVGERPTHLVQELNCKIIVFDGL